MCGIVGIHGRQDESWINAMNAVQVHRGPDGNGIFRDREAQLSLAMRRLAIIDIADGHQPMQTPDGRYVLVFNGEIFNAPDLRRELEQEGVPFATSHSDTEVLLHLLVRRGKTALSRLNGMFAFAFYDRDDKSLLCARDRFGIKPFYYLARDGRLAFASELKSLLSLPFVDREIDHQGLFHFMSLMYVPGAATIIRDIHRLPAGHLFEYRLDGGTPVVERWWQPEFSINTMCKTEDEWIERLRSGFEDAVHRWNLSDVPVACSLSGGLDSSAIVGALAKRGQSISTFSLGFAGDGEETWNELPQARAVAEKWGTNHQEIILDPRRLLDDLPTMVWALDEPYGGGLPSWHVFKFMSEHVKVAQTGTGGDELFGNYGKWITLEWKPGLGRLRRRNSLSYFRKKYHNLYYYMSDPEKRRFALENADTPVEDTGTFLHGLYTGAAGNGIRDRAASLDLATQLPEEFLMMTDRFSMAHSLEARTPLLDQELSDLVFSVPPAIRTSRRDPKALLRKVVAPYLPGENQMLAKKGFVIPLGLWLRGELRPLAEALLSPRRLGGQGLFKPAFFDRFVKPHLDGQADHTQTVWAALMFQLWHRIFIESSAIKKPDESFEALMV